MAKRHHQSKRARHHEHEGMERYERGEGHSPVPNTVSGLDSYRSHHMKGRGYGMISDDMSAPALLPRQIIDREYPKMDYVMGQGQIGSLFSGEQEMMAEDRHEMKKIFKPRKY